MRPRSPPGFEIRAVMYSDSISIGVNLRTKERDLGRKMISTDYLALYLSATTSFMIKSCREYRLRARIASLAFISTLIAFSLNIPVLAMDDPSPLVIGE